MTVEKTVRWSHCNQCKRQTHHNVLHTERRTSQDLIEENWIVEEYNTYLLLECRGCDAVHLEHQYSMSESVGADGHPLISSVSYPPRISRAIPAWLGDISGPFWSGSSVLEQMLMEIYAALHNDSLRLAAMGVRALLEFIMIDKVGDQGSIGRNIDLFLEAGYVAPVDRDTFKNKLIEAGHAAMHRGYKPNAVDLGILLDMTESLIASIYIHPKRMKALEERLPERKKTQTSKNSEKQENIGH